tara:strand:+ start:1207 stop:1488 length:282 start_codon:yes stop_codon:yes gene_type:complete
MNQIQRAFVAYLTIFAGFALVYVLYTFYIGDDFGLRKEGVADTIANCSYASAFVSAGSSLEEPALSSLARSILAIHVTMATLAKIWIVCGAPA